jgi:hypothetical protein
MEFYFVASHHNVLAYHMYAIRRMQKLTCFQSTLTEWRRPCFHVFGATLSQQALGI